VRSPSFTAQHEVAGLLHAAKQGACLRRR
jgi:hypothetical protein